MEPMVAQRFGKWTFVSRLRVFRCRLVSGQFQSAWQGVAGDSGKQYGDVLESGELRIEYREGEFCLLYGDYNLPLNPRQIKLAAASSMGRIRGVADIDSATRQEYESVLFHLDQIPDYQQPARRRAPTASERPILQLTG